MPEDTTLLTAAELDVLARAVKPLAANWADEKTHNEIDRQIRAFGIESFYQLALSNYLACFQSKTVFETFWPNFRLQFVFGSLADMTSEQTDLIVVATNQRFEFRDLPPRSLVSQLARREGTEYLEGYRPHQGQLRIDELVFVPSKALPGLTYCFVPVFFKRPDGQIEVSDERVRRGTRAVLERLLNPRKGDQIFSRVAMQLLGLGKLRYNDQPLIETLWKEIRVFGVQTFHFQRDKPLSLSLVVFRPKELLIFLKLFLVEHERLEMAVNVARQSYVLGDESERHERQIIAVSSGMRRALEQADVMADIEDPVLIVGESGAGKEVIARYIYQQSRRRIGPFIAQNCSNLDEKLIESILFGYKQGAYTDAKQDTPGLMDAAANGVLFLDEIGDLPNGSQAKLLRVIQERVYRPIGDLSETPLKARLILATNKDLRQEINSNRFREDLYYRISALSLQVPPLRDRREDIPQLIEHFTERISTERHQSGRFWAGPAMSTLIKYDWPGNVREVFNLVQRVLTYVKTKEITLEDLIENGPPEFVASLPEAAELQDNGLKKMPGPLFWRQFSEVYGGNGKRMAEAFGVAPSLISHYKKKHERFNPKLNSE